MQAKWYPNAEAHQTPIFDDVLQLIFFLQSLIFASRAILSSLGENHTALFEQKIFLQSETASLKQNPQIHKTPLPKPVKEHTHFKA